MADMVAIAGGDFHTIALRRDGTVWAWGDNGWGQLGDGTTTNRSIPVQVQGLADVVASRRRYGPGGGGLTPRVSNTRLAWAVTGLVCPGRRPGPYRVLRTLPASRSGYGRRVRGRPPAIAVTALKKHRAA